MKHMWAGLTLLVLVSHTAPSWAAEGSTLEQVGYGAGSALGTLVYVPFKATFCILGGLGAAATAIASPPTAGKVFEASCGGTWIITPDVVRGDEPVNFVGTARAARSVDTDTVAAK
jgi:hypothetical protein